MSKNNENKLVPKLRFPEFKNKEEWESMQIGSILIAESSSLALNKLELKQSGYAVYGADSIIGYIDTFQHKHPYISIVKDGSGVGRLNLCESETSTLGTLSALKSKDEKKYQIEWTYYLLNTIDFSSYVKGSGIPHIYYSDYKSQNIGVPKPDEQQKIADCLSSLDDVITAESQKLELLKDHKKGLLQNLFPQAGSAVPKFRFKEFENSGEWVERTIEEVAKVTTGNKDTQNKVDDGEFPFFVRSQNVERINSYSYDGEAILTSGDGVGVGKNFHYIVGKFDFHQRVYCIYDFEKEVSGRFVYMYFSQHFYERVMRMSAKNSVDSVRRAMITEMPILLPSKKEQEKIADTLSSIDDLIIAQNQKIEALQLHKKGLLQGLFPTLSETGFTGLKDEKDSKT